MTITMQEGAEQEITESGAPDDEETTKSVKQRFLHCQGDLIIYLPTSGPLALGACRN